MYEVNQSFLDIFLELNVLTDLIGAINFTVIPKDETSRLNDVVHIIFCRNVFSFLDRLFSLLMTESNVIGQYFDGTLEEFAEKEYAVDTGRKATKKKIEKQVTNQRKRR